MLTDSGMDRDYALELHRELCARLTDVDRVRALVERYRSAAPTFPETRFCKAVVLPVVDEVATTVLTQRHGATRAEVRRALRCEGYATPLYEPDERQVGFCSHSRSNSYHPGDKSGRRPTSRRSPDFAIRHPALRMLGETKYVERASVSAIARLLAELKDYLSIESEPTSDWGHDFGFGLLYGYGGEGPRSVQLIEDHWQAHRIFIARFDSPQGPRVV
jgi:hypothetical protein